MPCLCGDTECPSCGTAQGTLEPEDREGLCGCGRPESLDWHTCPYKVELNDNREALCRCCDHCTKECAYEI